MTSPRKLLLPRKANFRAAEETLAAALRRQALINKNAVDVCLSRVKHLSKSELRFVQGCEHTLEVGGGLSEAQEVWLLDIASRVKSLHTDQSET